MTSHNRTPEGAPIAQCSDEAACTVMSCEVCMKEIPADAIKVADAQDYVHHFCGLECLETWQKQAGIHPPTHPAKGSDRLK